MKTFRLRTLLVGVLVAAMGLAILAKAMERMRERAWAHSQPGQGGTFFLEIPK